MNNGTLSLRINAITKALKQPRIMNAKVACGPVRFFVQSDAHMVPLFSGQPRRAGDWKFETAPVEALCGWFGSNFIV
ncbi:MAG: hypothetical protein QM760_11435 [Nibricoccus sp.]